MADCWIYYDMETGCELFRLDPDDDPAVYGDDLVTMSDEDYADYQRVRQEHRAWQNRLYDLKSRSGRIS